MFSLRQILIVFLLLNIFIVVIFLNTSVIEASKKGNYNFRKKNSYEIASKTLYIESRNTINTISSERESLIPAPGLAKTIKSEQDQQHKKEEAAEKKAHLLARKIFNQTEVAEFLSPTLRNKLQNANPFRIFGFYNKLQDKYFNSFPKGKSRYHRSQYGIAKDPGYCETVDLYNIMNPTNVFNKMNFFSDYAKDECNSILKIFNKYF